jgi:hypothetical protein
MGLEKGGWRDLGIEGVWETKFVAWQSMGGVDTFFIDRGVYLGV